MSTTREQYVEETKKKLDEWNSQLDRAEKHLGEASDTGREKLQTELRSARETYAAAVSKLEEMKQAGGDATQRVEDEVENFVTALDRSVKYFRSQL